MKGNRKTAASIRQVLSASGRMLRSLKFTTMLIAYFIVMLSATAIIQQGITAGAIAPRIASTFEAAGFANFFTSFWFIAPLLAFLLNLLLCTIHRIHRQLKSDRDSYFGPDIVHIGILFLIVAALISLFGRMEGELVLAEGQTGKLPGGVLVTLVKTDQEQYPDGRPKEWRSRVLISRPPDKVYRKTIRVNHPAHVGRLGIYLSGEGFHPELVLTDYNDKEYRLLPGDEIATEERGLNIRFAGVIQEDSAGGISAIIETVEPGAGGGEDHVYSRYTHAPGEKIPGELIISEISYRPITIFMVTGDPGFIPLVVSFILIMSGLFFIFLQKVVTRGKK